ncbi:TonB-dependent receptor [Sphaerotilus sp.]|uniref:TonB-dependent receptor n=1 Tax=Sphaerotilus sp. TaxID=2093942 RepID=UPI002ACE12D9|nr:TonB-dependent receptor [Sphaerotilus sp.]MDZ7855879.1 TonB-dependent receptor [Sphaerotilus sp.]
MNKNWCGAVAAFLIATTDVLAQAAVPIAPAPAQAASAPGGAQLPTVTVVAAKRAQATLDVPAAVSSATADQLQRAGVQATDALDAVFPELASMGRSSRIYNNFTVRGAASADFYGPGLLLVVDGVPQLPHAYAQGLLDVARVDLLKGPQGAIYGRGAIGGVLSVQTARPGGKPTAEASAELGPRGHSVTGNASTGVSDSGWALQAGLADARQDGTLDDPATGGRHVDDRHNRGGRVALSWLSPTLPLEARVKLGSERYRSNEEYYVPFSPMSRAAVGPVVMQPLIDRRVDDVAADVQFVIGKHWTLSGVLGWQQVDLDRVIGSYGISTPEAQRSRFAEARAAYRGEVFDAVLGVADQQLRFERKVASFVYGPYTFGDARSVNDVHNLALFADGTWRLAPAWELTAGVRWARERAEVDMARTGGTPGTEVTYRGSDSNGAVTPRVALTYQLAPDQRLFAGIGRGFKPGGFNKAGSSTADAIAYRAETATSLEAGWKWAARGGRQHAGVTIYQVHGRDVQGWVGPLGLQTLSNVGNATSRGLEFDLAMPLGSTHEISVGGMVNRSRYDDYSNPAGNLGRRDVPYAPTHSLRLSWSARWGQSGAWQPQVTLRRVGGYWFDPENTLRQSAYTVVDAGLTWTATPALELGLLVRNAGDTLYRTYADAAGAQLGAAREAVLQLRTRF